jgi:hypothetical protein
MERKGDRNDCSAHRIGPFFPVLWRTCSGKARIEGPWYRGMTTNGRDVAQSPFFRGIGRRNGLDRVIHLEGLILDSDTSFSNIKRHELDAFTAFVDRRDRFVDEGYIFDFKFKDRGFGRKGIG